MFSFVFISALRYAVACCLRIAISPATIGNYIMTNGSTFAFLCNKATCLIQIALVVFSILISRDNYTARLTRPRSGDVVGLAKMSPVAKRREEFPLMAVSLMRGLVGKLLPLIAVASHWAVS